MPKREVYEVKYDKARAQWAVAQRGGRQVGSYDTKGSAVAEAKSLAKRAALGQVIIKTQKGRIQTEHTYGKDPRRSKG